MTRGRRVFIIVDALGWDTAAEYDLFPELAARAPVRTVLGYSSAAIPCLLSGALPRDNGHWSVFMLTDQPSPLGHFRHLARLPSRLQGYRVRRLGERWAVRRHGLSGYLNTYEIPFAALGRMDTCEKRSPFLPGGIRNGTSIIDSWTAAGIPFSVFAYPMTDAEVMSRTLAALRRGSDQRVLAYITSWDALLHAGPPGRPEARAMMDTLQGFVRDVRREMDDEHDRVAVFSDHGMTKVTATIDVSAALNDASVHVDCAVVDSTMCRVWLRDERDGPAVGAVFDGVPGGHVLNRDERVAEGIDFPDRSFGDVIYLADPACVISPNNMGHGIPYGMHGYHPSDATTQAVALASHPLPPVSQLTQIRTMMESW